MPWKIRETDGEFCIMEVDGDKVVKCHPSMQEAKDHMAALYANVEDATKAGARNNTRDLRRLQEIHDLARENGAVCETASEVTTLPLEIKTFDNSLKSISLTDDEFRVGNYIVVFGGRDLTGIAQRKNQDGSLGEYFTPATDLESSYTKSGVLHVDFEHSQDPDELGIGRDDVLGFVDWKTAKKDERGVFVERVLNRRQKYVNWLKDLVDAGLIGNSTEAIDTQVERGKDGEIKRWPLRRDTLTVNPMEPRMLNQNVMAAVKALQEVMPSLKSVIPPVLGDNSPAIPTEGEAEAVMAQSEGGTAEKSIPISEEQNTMDEKDVALLQQAVKDAAKEAAESAVKAYRESEPPLQTAEANIQVVTDATEQPFETAGKFFMAVKSAGFYPSREDPRLKSLKATGMSEGVPADGGYLIPPQYAAGIWERMYTQGNILNRISVDTVSGNSMTYNANAETSRATGSRWGGVRGYWLAEGASKTASAPTWRQVELKLKKIAALCYATDEQLEDTAALESWLQRTVPNELKFMVEDSVVNGDGVGKPLGIMQQPARVSVLRTTGSASLVVADIANMLARAYNYGDSYVWLADASIIPQLVQLAITYPVYLPAGGLSAKPYDSLFGRPILYTEYNAALGTEGDIILADLSQYQAISKGGIKSASSIHVAFTTDETCFRFVYRFDGTSLWNSALTPFNAGATLSPFVTLNASSS